MDIPFSTYVGGLKQIDTAFRAPIMKELFDLTFGKFSGLHEMYKKLQDQNVKYIISAAGVQLITGGRPRRFAGDMGLPSGRYFTVCSDEGFNDHGTLRDEMYAYYEEKSGINPLILDPKVDMWLPEFLISNNFFSREDLNYPYFAFLYRAIKNNDNKMNIGNGFIDRGGKKSLVTYGIKQLSVQIENVIDLRLPDTQEWFAKTFVGLELENEKVALKKTGLYIEKDAIQGFGELLPVIMSLEIGGGKTFGQAVGAWMRMNGVLALIFPSARSTCENIVKNGKIISSKGWNLVLYHGAPPVKEANLFGYMSTWYDPDDDHIRIKYEDKGENRGSLSVRGAKEWNLLKFDHDKAIYYKDVDTSISDLIGVTNARITKKVNKYLNQQAQNNHLWYHDIDTTDFIAWYENIWINK